MLKIEVEVARPKHRYDILFEPGLCSNWRGEVDERLAADSYLVLFDANLAGLHGFPEPETTEGPWRYLWVEPGERNKSLDQYVELCEKAVAMDIDRGTVLVALGGGVTGDIAGLVAATLLRGLRFVNIPTTLLAQVDSSVGGKNAVNTLNGKNLVGTFLQPELVLIDPAFLVTLPRREFIAGLGEIVKMAILEGIDFFEELQRSTDILMSRNLGFLAGIIARSCRYKAVVVAEDEFERGRRQLLNLGHTFAHCLEALAGFDDTVVHGEAVAVGIALACEFSMRRGILPVQKLEEVRMLLAALGLPVSIRQLGGEGGIDWRNILTYDALAAALHGDKKMENGKLNLILPHSIGDCRLEKGFSIKEIAVFMQGCMDG